MIREVVQEGRMPPWFADPKYGHFANDARLSDEEKQQIGTWVENGCPQGDAKDLPEPRKFAEGWRIGEPDQVVYMRDKPYTVPAEGAVDYQFFTVDPGWTDDKWIQATEARPGNRAVVHHIIVFVQPKDGNDGGGRGGIGGYAPGMTAEHQPAGHGHVRAGRLEAGLPDALHAQRHRSRTTAAWSASSLPIPRRSRRWSAADWWATRPSRFRPAMRTTKSRPSTCS